MCVSAYVNVLMYVWICISVLFMCVTVCANPVLRPSEVVLAKEGHGAGGVQRDYYTHCFLEQSWRTPQFQPLNSRCC